MNSRTWRPSLVAVLSLALLNAGFVPLAQADVIETGALVRTHRDAHIASIQSQLARDEVRSQLARFGVGPGQIEDRLAAMSDSELAALATRMQETPAGGDGLLAIIGLTFVVLIILELVGVIDVFKRSPAR